MMDFGEYARVKGGSMKDGLHLSGPRLGVHGSYERLVFDLSVSQDFERGPSVAAVGAFLVEMETHPYRLVLTFSGVRSADVDRASLSESSAVRDLYRIPYLDDSTVVYALTLTQPVEYRAFELESPGRVVLDLRYSDSVSEMRPIYSLRTASLPETHVEPLGHLAETLIWLGSGRPRILSSGDNTLFVEEGAYLTAGEAVLRRDALMTRGLPGGVSLYVERRGPMDTPDTIGETEEAED